MLFIGSMYKVAITKIQVMEAHLLMYVFSAEYNEKKYKKISFDFHHQNTMWPFEKITYLKK